MSSSGGSPNDEGPSKGHAQLLVGAGSMERFRFTTTRPVAVLMVFLAVVVFGAFSMGRLPLSLMPDISYPKLTVRTEYAGAAPAEVENNVSRPLEEILGVVTGLTRIESISRAGYSDVVLEFAWDTDMDDANQDVLEKIDAVKSVLPDEIKQPLILRYDPSLDPVLNLSLSGTGARFEGTAGLKFLRRVGERDVRRLLEPVDGVAAVKVKGGLEEEIHVELDEDELRRTGIGIDTVINRLKDENINLAGGSMREGRTRYLVRTVNEFRDLEDIRETVIVSRDGRDVKLRHIAAVGSGFKDRDVITRVDGREAVEVEVYKEADANIVDMAAQVRDRLASVVQPRLREQYGVDVRLVTDQSRFIESSINEVRDTAVLGGALAVLVLFLFLRDVRTTAIIGVSIPISVLVTFAPLNLAGVSLNIMSLGGLALGVGMLVDNSIVVLESIHRCRQEGDDLIRATVRGTAEVGSAVFASTLTSVAVFFPMVFVEGVAGQMFGDLGLTIVFSLLASLAVALFFIPMLASRRGIEAAQATTGAWRELGQMWRQWSAFADLRQWWQRRRVWHFAALVPVAYVLLRFLIHLLFDVLGKLIGTSLLVVVLVGGGSVYWVARGIGVIIWPILWLFDRFFGALERGYPPVIRWGLANKVIVYAIALGSVGVMAFGLDELDTELVPEMHQGEFTVEMALPVGTPLDQTNDVVRPIEDRILTPGTVPHLHSLTTIVGSERDSSETGERGEHSVQFRVNLVDRGAPAQTAPRDLAGAESEALLAIRGLLATVPDATLHVTRPVLFSFKTPVEIEIRGYDLEQLAQATQAVAARLQAVPELRDVKASIQPGNPEVQIDYDRDALARQGLDIRQVAELVRDKVQGNEATQFNRKDRKIPILVRIEGITEANVDDLRDLVVNPGGTRPVPLSAVARIHVGRGPNEIRRVGQQRVGVVTANLEGAALGAATDRIRAELEAFRSSLPPTVDPVVTGQSEEWDRSSRSLFFALGLSIFLVYVIMASQFESLVYPLIILVSVPLAFVGVVVTLWVLGLPVSVVVFLGAIMLTGIVVNNAIVLVDYVNQLKARGMATSEALELAGRVRLRPILMTTATTVLGLLPMALGVGDGAEIRMPMAVTVIAGLIFSTLLTLVVIPTLYGGVDRWRKVAVVGPAERLAREVEAVEPEQLAAEVEDPIAADDGEGKKR